MAYSAVLVVFPLCLAFSAFADLFTMTIPNRVSVILFGAFFVVAPMIGFDLEEIGLHTAAALVVFSACFAFFALNVMGGGDAKLLSACAIWFGLTNSLVVFLIYVSFFGGLLTLAVLLIRMHEDKILAIGIPVPHLLLTQKKIPYAVAIAFGGFLAYPASPPMLATFLHLNG
ncbi:A24 family peptidase [Ensifer canadensis]|jgi:prepilin peptidase CpaA